MIHTSSSSFAVKPLTTPTLCSNGGNFRDRKPMKYPTLLAAIVALSASFLWKNVVSVESGIPIDVTQQGQLRQPAMPSYSRGYPFSTAGIPLTYAAATKSAFSGTSSSSECILPRRGADRGGSLLRANPDTKDNKRAGLFGEDLLTSRTLIPLRTQEGWRPGPPKLHILTGILQGQSSS